jgi:acyl dehydratase
VASERPRLDLESVGLPLELGATPRTIDRQTADGWIAALGERQSASLALVGVGLVPPQGVSGSTIFLGYSHYDLSGGVYSREQVTFHRPLHLDEPLSVAGSIAYSYPKRGRRYRVMASRTTDSRGRTVVSSRSTSVEAFVESGVGSEESPKGEDVVAPTVDPTLQSANPCVGKLLALSAGDVIRGTAQIVTLDMMLAWDGGQSHNPIHTDPARAAREGLGRPIAGGPQVLAFLQEALMEELGPEVFLYGSHFDVRWIAPVRTDTEVRSSAVVAEVRNGVLSFDLAMECDEDPCLVGRASIPVEGTSR